MPLDQILSFFAAYIESCLGIVYAEHNYFQLQNRLEEIAKLLGVSSIEALHEKAQIGISGPFQQLLLDVATNNETSFFRDPKVFKGLEAVIFSNDFKVHDPNAGLRIWSAASSSGQEAVSTTIMLVEGAKKRSLSLPFEIIGTDISERILAKASRAEYTQLEVQRGLPAPLMIKYFSKTPADTWKPSAEIMDHIQYRKLNLKDSFSALGVFDVILCRNVLIYQSVERKSEIIRRLHQCLSPHGVMVLGSGESLIGLSDAFEIINVEGAVIYMKKRSSKIVA